MNTIFKFKRFAFALLLALGALGISTAVALAGTSSPLGPAARRALVSYALVLGAAAARSDAGWRLAPVLATMHLSWGAGLLRGLAAPGRR